MKLPKPIFAVVGNRSVWTFFASHADLGSYLIAKIEHDHADKMSAIGCTMFSITQYGPDGQVIYQERTSEPMDFSTVIDRVEFIINKPSLFKQPKNVDSKRSRR